MDNGNTNAEGTPVIQWTWNGGDQQKWAVIGVGSGYYKLVSKKSGKALDTGGSPPTAVETSGVWRRGKRAVGRMREHLAAAGMAPYDLARRRRPLALVDLVWAGRTFTTLQGVMRDWVEESREPWPVNRSRLRYLGITARTETSPKTWRWQQHHPWTGDLPARAVQNVSLDRSVWNLLGDHEPKTAPSFPPQRWHDDAVSVPVRGDGPTRALATAVALVEAGRLRPK